MTVGDVYCTVVEMIPWVVNETATDGEAREVHQHVLTCSACRRELACTAIVSLRMRHAMSALPSLAPAERARLWGQAEAPEPDGSLLSALARLLDALGMPGILGEMLRTGAAHGGERAVLRLEAPLLAPIEIQL